ncbi:MAG TPA: IS5 family transposase [Accumulibacter sp.]|uniref:IS5 family transposase n=1 Tax=Candidatus Accumulibacter TaxID=327159 RepID=UPI001FE7199C|nr:MULTISPECIES: IS5 family transposase [Candidatus Accumulibacter]MCC2867289.1 IS5 family transposase [Candidatus Accumulibacter phosphatis]MCQ1547309.1 IS5 family transposase [Candidatus Accumulibacter phosphatis]HMW56113.1 IS5 family transposase [Accumulibacter sp.]HNC20935.1 IS5 family transposase [Accumulibacter sp.]HNF91852.1 IS5 family transposase [Accumulibacter sp.]
MEPLLQGREDTVGVTARDNRLFVEAVLYLYRAGIPWRDLPECSGAWKVVHTRFSRWARNGLWKNLFKHLAIEADNEYAMMDRTIVRVHQHSEGARKHGPQAIGRSRGGLSTQIHASVDILGNPVGFHLTPGQSRNLDGADVLLPQTAANTIIADKGDAADQRVLEALAEAGKTALIPPKRPRVEPREDDRDLYLTRHLIENFFQKLQQYRSIATLYDNTARNFLATIYLTSTIIWLR